MTLVWSHVSVWVHISEYKFYSTANCVRGSLIFLSDKWSNNTTKYPYGPHWSAYNLHPVDWMIGSFWKFMYSVLSFWWLLNRIHVLFLWIIMVIILWWLGIRIVLVMGIMVLFVVLMLICMLILINVYFCDIILVLRVLISILIHYCNLRSLIHYCNIDIFISNGITFTIINCE